MLSQKQRKQIEKKIKQLNRINFICFLIAIAIVGVMIGFCEKYPIVCLISLIPTFIILAIMAYNEPYISALENALAVDYIKSLK